MASAAIPAATLILVREPIAGSPELLMVERSAAMVFAPGALVFPGGRIDAADAEFAMLLGHADGGARIAAVRETLEECGVPVGLEPVPDHDRCLALQDALLGGEGFRDLLEAEGLRLDITPLAPFARWLPPEEASRRFDTSFFLARTDAGHIPRPGSGECVSARWITTAAALDEQRGGLAKLIYPTFKNLERLAQFDSFDAMFADTLKHPVVPITATIEQRGGAAFVAIPEGAGYPITIDPVDRVWRG